MLIKELYDWIKTDVDTRDALEVTIRPLEYVCRVRNFPYYQNNLSPRMSGKKFQIKGLKSTALDGEISSFNYTDYKWQLWLKWRNREYIDRLAIEKYDCTADMPEEERQSLTKKVFPYELGYYEGASRKEVYKEVKISTSYTSFKEQLEQDMLWLAVYSEELSIDNILIPLEWCEELYEDAYANLKQWYKCDGYDSRFKGHRWERPVLAGSRYSPHFQDKYFMRCAECGELFHKNQLKEYMGKMYCFDCLDKMGVRWCQSCDSPIDEDSLYISYCKSCGDEKVRYTNNKTYISDYHGFDAFRKHFLRNEQDIDKKYYLGCEIEADGYGCPDEDNGREDELLELRSIPFLADIQSDGSLEDGFECILHPCTHGYLKQNIKRIVQPLAWDWNDSDCSEGGMHIHVSKLHTNQEQLTRLDFFMHLHKRKITNIAERESTEWASLNNKCVEDNSWSDFGLNAEGRYEALNFRNSKTVEFRIFNFPQTVNQAHRFVDFAHSLMCFHENTTKDLFFSSVDTWELYKFYVNEHKDKYDSLVKHNLINYN